MNSQPQHAYTPPPACNSPNTNPARLILWNNAADLACMTQAQPPCRPCNRLTAPEQKYSLPIMRISSSGIIHSRATRAALNSSFPLLLHHLDFIGAHLTALSIVELRRACRDVVLSPSQHFRTHRWGSASSGKSQKSRAVSEAVRIFARPSLSAPVFPVHESVYARCVAACDYARRLPFAPSL